MSQAKSLVIIHATADEKEVAEFGKHLAPLEASGELRVWTSLSAPPGSNRFEAIKDALKDADMVVFWVSVDLWAQNDEFDFLLENREIIPPNAQVVPLIARSATWESVPFIKQYTSNAIPFDKQPIPSGSKERQDAWMDGVARSITEKLGLTPKPKVSIKSFWKRISHAERVGIVLGFLAIIVGVPSFIKDCRGNQEGKVQEKAVVQPTRDAGCGFPGHFVRDTLYVLITRFEDLENKSGLECYGKGIERRIDQLVESQNLPIRFCYRDDLRPNQRRHAESFRDESHADIIIWGKLQNAGPDCNADGFCLQFNPSDSLINYIGRKVSTPEANDYQRNVSAFEIEQGQIRMGAETFDDWLIGMFNLKIRQQNPASFVVAKWWDKDKKTEAFLLRAILKGTAGDDLAAISDFDQIIMLDSEKSQTYNLRGIAKGNIRQWGEALKDFDMFIKLRPNLATGYFNRGTTQSYLGEYKDAIADFNQAIILDPSFALAYSNRATCKFCLEDLPEAIVDYNFAINIDSLNPLFFHNRGFAKFSLKQFSEAITDYNHAIYLNPNYADAFGKRGLAKASLGKFKEAIGDYDKAIILKPSNAVLYNNRGLSKHTMGLLNEAVSDYEKSLSLIFKDETRMNLDFALWEIAQNRKVFWRNCTLIFLLITLIYLWKFKTINRHLRRLFTRLSQALKKLLHRP